MKSKIKYLALLAIAFSLFACGQKEAEKPAETPAATEQAAPATTEQATPVAAEEIVTEEAAPAVDAQAAPEVEEVTVIEEAVAAQPDQKPTIDQEIKQGTADATKALDNAGQEVKQEAEKVTTDVKKEM